MSNQNKQHELRKIVKELEKHEGRGTQLVSVYIPPHKPISTVISHISNEYGEANNIKQKQTRKNVQSALSSIKSRLKYYDETPDNGMAIFSGVIDRESRETETIVIDSLPEEIQSYRYHCDNTFLTEPLQKMIKTGKTFALLVLDRKRAQIGKLVGSKVIQVDSLESQVPGKHSAGGQSQKRFERVIEEKTENFYKKVSERFNSEFIEERYDIEGVLIGGPSPTKEEFLNSGGLHHKLKEKIIGVFDVGDTTERGLYELIERSSNKIKESKISNQREIMNKFFKNLKSSNKTATYGLSEVLDALQIGAASHLLISDSIATKTVTVGECHNGHLNISYNELNECHKCSSSITKTEKNTLKNIFESLSEKRGSNITYISDGFEKGKQLKDVFGGIGALMRFEVV